MNRTACHECPFCGEGNADAVWTTGMNHAIDTGHKVDIHVASPPNPGLVPIWGDIQVQASRL